MECRRPSVCYSYLSAIFLSKRVLVPLYQTEVIKRENHFGFAEHYEAKQPIVAFCDILIYYGTRDVPSPGNWVE